MQDLIGHRRYAVLELLGTGRLAQVMRARDRRLEVDRAIKILPPSFGAFPEFLERFKREARIMARVRHLNVCQVHDVGVEGGRGYLVMDLLSPQTLKLRIKIGGPEPRQAGAWMIQVLDGLSALHAVGCVHRDLRPGNLMFGASGQIVIADFGVSSLPDSHPITLAGQELGVWPYVAPEQLQDAHAVDARADIFAAGATLVFLLTGASPYAIYEPAKREALLASLPERWRPICVRAVAPKPADRFPSATSFAEAIRAITI